ncbi:unannotated protein [freshwater metagenome]|uniref:Unannotated protein n=1 Tax=freshwater metagenome TaxID=449393 RepID=A0A6J7EEI5_9ZZZZ|nr:signal peptidase II [Actinomycetota bacterium]
MSRGRTVALTLATMAGVLAVDQIAKALVRSNLAVGERRDVVGSVLRLAHVENDGVAFGRLGGGGVLVAVVVAVAVLGLLGFLATHLETPLVWLPSGLILGGALGNVIDRLHSSAVTDFVKLPHWPAFNLADVAITVGVVLLLVVVERDARRKNRADAPGKIADGAAGGG